MIGVLTVTAYFATIVFACKAISAHSKLAIPAVILMLVMAVITSGVITGGE